MRLRGGALRSRDFRLLLLGQFTSQAGYFAFYVAQGWLALELTDSPAFVGVTVNAGQLPFLLLSLPAGVLADRIDRRRLMIYFRALAAAAFTAEGLLAASGVIQPWHLLVMALIAGTGITLDNPPQQRLMADFVPARDIPNAASLVGVVLQVSVIAGPLLGGWLLVTRGPEACFFAGAAGNGMLALVYLAMRIPRGAPAATRSAWSEATMGVTFVARQGAVLACWVMMALAMIAIVYQGLMPVYARDELGLGGFELGILLMVPGIGATLGASLVSVRRLVPPGVSSMAVALFAAGSMLAVLGWTTTLASALLVLLVLGAAWGLVYPLGMAVALLRTPAELRGRVVSVFFILWGLPSITAGVAGALAAESSTRVVFALGGQAVAACGLVAILLAGFVRLWKMRAAQAAPVASAPPPPAPSPPAPLAKRGSAPVTGGDARRHRHRSGRRWW